MIRAIIWSWEMKQEPTHAKWARKRTEQSPRATGTWVGVRNAAVDKTYECTKIPNIRGTLEWPLVNRGHLICFRHGSHATVPHDVMITKVAAEFGLDPTVVALKNDGCRGHDWDWVTRYQKENGFPQRWSLKEVIDKGKEAIGWIKKWHAPGAKSCLPGNCMALDSWRSTNGLTGPRNRR